MMTGLRFFLFTRLATVFVTALLTTFSYAADCKTVGSYLESLSAEQSRLQEEIDRLQELNRPDFKVSGALPDLLFSIDLDDNKAVNQRLEQLRVEAKDFVPISLRPDGLPEECFKVLEVLQKEQEFAALQKEKLGQKISFLSLPAKARNERLATTTSSIKDQSELASQIDKKLEASQKQKSASEQSIDQARSDIKSAVSVADKIFAEARLDIENYRAELAKVSIDWFSDLGVIIDRYVELSERLEKIEISLSGDSAKSVAATQILFQKSSNIWRKIIDDAFTVYKMFEDVSALNTIPDLPDNFGRLRPDQQTALQNLRIQALQELEEFQSSQNDKLKQHFINFYELFAKASYTRSQCLKLARSIGLSGMDLNPFYFQDLGREILAIPIRLGGYLYQKFMTVRQDLDGSAAGALRIFNALISLIVLFFIPMIARYTTRKVSAIMDRYRESLLKDKRDFSGRQYRTAFWVKKLTPYVPFLLYLFFIWLLDRNLAGTIFDEIRIFLPILQFYIYYRIFRLLVQETIALLDALIEGDIANAQKMAESTSKLVGYFFLFSYVTMYLTELTVNRGLLYNFVAETMKFIGYFVCALAAYRWRQFIAPAARQIIPGRFGEKLAQLCEGRLAFVTTLPVLLIVLGKHIFNFTWAWLSTLEFSKRILAKIYRRKIEASSQNLQKTTVVKPPESYLELFDIEEKVGAQISANEDGFNKIVKEVKGWISGEEEDQSIAVYGEKGVGKSFLLKRVASTFTAKGIHCIDIDLQDKVYTKQGLSQFLANRLKVELQENPFKMILEYNKDCQKKTLILLDNAQNLFLGKIGGFEAIKNFVELINLKTDQLFWCCSFNDYAWAYLKGVLGTAQYFRSEVNLGPWSDQAIRELISSRHDKSGYRLSYDQMILAARQSTNRIEATKQAEEQFFRLLWEQSNGNPRVALYLWTTCISLQGQNELKVSIPERLRVTSLLGHDDNYWFVLAAIAKHENLTRKEAADVTNLDWGHVAHAIKVGLETKVIFRSDTNRYRLHFSSQQDILKQLRMKNFIYGTK